MITCVHCVDLEKLQIKEMILFILSSTNSHFWRQRWDRW